MSPPEESTTATAETEPEDTNFELSFISALTLIASTLIITSPLPSSLENWWESPIYSAALFFSVVINGVLGVLATRYANKMVLGIWLFSLVFAGLAAFKVIPLG